MNEQKNIALGIAILVVIVALFVGILVFPQRGPFSHIFKPRDVSYWGRLPISEYIGGEQKTYGFPACPRTEHEKARSHLTIRSQHQVSSIKNPSSSIQNPASLVRHSFSDGGSIQQQSTGIALIESILDTNNA